MSTSPAKAPVLSMALVVKVKLELVCTNLTKPKVEIASYYLHSRQLFSPSQFTRTENNPHVFTLFLIVGIIVVCLIPIVIYQYQRHVFLQNHHLKLCPIPYRSRLLSRKK